jgi:hypothetical protein
MQLGMDNVCGAVGIAIPVDANDAMHFAKSAL